MDWSKYVKQFKRQAKKAGHDGDYVQRCLAYAHSLYQKNLPIIYDQRHLALLVGYSPDYIYRAANGSQHFYRNFKIPKHAGGFRDIAEPLPSLKEIQKWILSNILYGCEPSPFAKAFVPKRSIRENARFHRRQPMVLSLDIVNFLGPYPQIKFTVSIKGLVIVNPFPQCLLNFAPLIEVFHKEHQQAQPYQI
jgi:RNA-directed DNA polymerase